MLRACTGSGQADLVARACRVAASAAATAYGAQVTRWCCGSAAAQNHSTLLPEPTGIGAAERVLDGFSRLSRPIRGACLSKGRRCIPCLDIARKAI